MSEIAAAPSVSASDIGAVKVVGLDGKERALGEAWSARNVVLTFIRHFG